MSTFCRSEGVPRQKGKGIPAEGTLVPPRAFLGAENKISVTVTYRKWSTICHSPAFAGREAKL